ncbi:MAG: PrgI family protein [Candidatus Saccharibacteria bacterium]
MAQYKVPQDVEADDKLIGPFSFRQFIYLVIVVLAIALAWGLWQLFIPLSIIPIPIIIFFGALALPLRKDQPMEIYMAAIVSFYLKPHKRLWDPDGIESLIEITVPKIVEYSRTKDLTKNEAERRFSYLAEIVDSQGWSVRGPGIQAPNSAMNTDVYYEAQQASDVLDINNSTMQNIDYKLNRSDAQRHQDMVGMMQNKTTQTNNSNYFSGVPLPEPTTAPETTGDKLASYDPYPNIQQAVIQPIGEEKMNAKQTINTSEKVVAAGIINLASNNDLSIAAIANEARRIQEKQDVNEVIIKLR